MYLNVKAANRRLGLGKVWGGGQLDNYYSLKKNECIYVLDKTWSWELEILKNAYVTVVAMATMTFQNGGNLLI